jgi:hypothetical protein
MGLMIITGITMNRNRFYLLLTVISAISMFAVTIDIAYAQTNIHLEKLSQSAVDVSLPEIIKLEENIFQIGGVKINKKEMSASINGVINMSDGLVEYLACSPKGKLHESVLNLYAEPYHIQMALLLLGLAPGDMPLDFQGAPQQPCGDPVKIMISWKENAQRMEYSPEDLIVNIKTKTPMEQSDWVFTGSKILDNQYMAQVEGSIMAVYHDPFAMIDHRSKTGADDTLFYANKGILPPVGTPIVFKILQETNLKVKKRVRCKKNKK